MAKRRVVITGVGVIAPNGTGKEAFWNALTSGKSGISRITRFDPTPFHSQIAGEVKDFDPVDFISPKKMKQMDRFAQYGFVAARMAYEDAKFTQIEPKRAGIVVGTVLAGIEFSEKQYNIFCESGGKRVSAYAPMAVIINSCSSQIAIDLKFSGPSETISTGCASSASAIGRAVSLIRNNDLDVMIAGGAEAPIIPIVLGSFCAIRAVSRRNADPERACRPFDKERDGTVISEGAAMLVLEEYTHAVKRKAHIYAEIIGYGTTCDAYHMIQPSPSGIEAKRAIKLALEDSSIHPEEIDYINAHGSSTPQNDKIETEIIRGLFGEHSKNLAISANKSMTGHLQGASSALEIVASALTIRHKIIPPTINYEVPDPDCDLNYVPNQAIKKDVNTILSNSFGFGGKNAAIVMRKI
ncbi:beta-ketoacyl-ACP synthase II [Candidatus Margulisiibacteriota bacterium]